MSNRWLTNIHRLKTSCESGILFEVLSVFVERGRSDGLKLTAGQHRLENRGGIDRTFGCTGTHQRVNLVDEGNDVAAGANLFGDLLQALFEVTAVTRTGDERAHVEGVKLLALERLGNVAVDDCLSETFDDSGLSNTRFTNQDRVVL